MKGSQNQDIISYPGTLKISAAQFSKRLSIQQFKKIDEQRIKKQFKILQNGEIQKYQQVMCEGFKNKNRYSDVLTYQHNRIKLEQIKNYYLNASLMDSVVDNKTFAIFAQAPLKNTFQQFWQANYHFNITRIVMLCGFQDPKRGPQAQKYWPRVNQTFKFKDIQVYTQSQQILAQQFTRTKIKVKGPQGVKSIQHNHWMGWNDMSKPLGENSQALFRCLVAQCLSSIQKKQLILIHCSAGIGRTGTLGAVIQGIRCGRVHKQLSVFQIVHNMRQHRMSCVQTIVQYIYIYQQLQKWL